MGTSVGVCGPLGTEAEHGRECRGRNRGTGGARVAVQKFGTFLSGMIMPNIAAFIAWGFITAFFIETGWTPVEGLGVRHQRGWGPMSAWSGR